MTHENTTALMAAAGVGRVTVESSVSEVAALEAVKTAVCARRGRLSAANAGGRHRAPWRGGRPVGATRSVPD